MTFSKRLTFLFTMLRRSALDFCIFMTMLMIFVSSFGFGGYILFSGDVMEFRQLHYAVGNMFRAIVSDLDYDMLLRETQVENWIFASLYYVVWGVFVILVLSNVFIAILSESYANVQIDFDRDLSLKRVWRSVRNQMKENWNTKRNRRGSGTNGTGTGDMHTGPRYGTDGMGPRDDSETMERDGNETFNNREIPSPAITSGELLRAHTQRTGSPFGSPTERDQLLAQKWTEDLRGPIQAEEAEVDEPKETIPVEEVKEEKADDELQQWLTNDVGHPEYTDAFVANGYDSLPLIAYIEKEQELEDFGIVDKEHQKRIMEEIEKLKEKKDPTKDNDDQQQDPVVSKKHERDGWQIQTKTPFKTRSNTLSWSDKPYPNKNE